MAYSSAMLNKVVQARLVAAAEVIAAAAGANASQFSRRIPKSIKVIPSKGTVLIIAGGNAAPNADPFEYGKKHPLFGHWETGPQYFMKKRPFLEEAAVSALDKAADEFAKVFDDICDALDL